VAEFDGSRVVAVGASSGIGRAVAELAGRSGAPVLGLSRTGASPEGAMARTDRIDHLVFTASAPGESPRVSELLDVDGGGLL
jgi:NAD(P)-dependent dehydrogenase (short-subunit alcohol dehydrogenase family)